MFLVVSDNQKKFNKIVKKNRIITVLQFFNLWDHGESNHEKKFLMFWIFIIFDKKHSYFPSCYMIKSSLKQKKKKKKKNVKLDC